jgi:non-specific protein-tyrosine kinase
MELKQYFSVVRKWWWLMLASIILASIASLLATRNTPRIYQSRTTLMVGQALQNPNPSQSEFFTGQALAQSYSDLARREPVLRATLDALGLDWDWPVLQNMVSSRWVAGTSLLEISILDTDPQRAKILVEELTNQLILRSPAGNDPEREAERQFIGTQLADLKSNIQKSQEEIKRLNTVIAEANSARAIQDARTQQTALQSQITEWQATYSQLSTLLNVGTANFLSVVELPQVPTTPVSSSTASNVIMAAMIGLALAVAAAFLLEYLDDTIRTPEDIDRTLKLAALGTIANVRGGSLGAELISARQPRSPATEAYRALRVNIQFSMVDRTLRTILVTSANPGEGKSTIACNLAIVIAQAGARVILVDSDLRRPTLHRIFALPNSSGLTSILLDPDTQLPALIQASGVDNLRIMTSGPQPPNPSELLGSKRMESVIEALQQEADIIIFDSPPVLAATDGLVLSSRVDATILIIRAGHTRRSPARHAREALKTVGANTLGAVLNRLAKSEHSMYQGYYYAEDGEKRKTREKSRANQGQSAS